VKVVRGRDACGDPSGLAMHESRRVPISRVMLAAVLAIGLAGILLQAASPAYCGQDDDLDFILAYRSDHKPFAGREATEIGENSLGLSPLAVGVIRFYQRFVASQDLPSCNFTPSCSDFTAQAIGRAGLLRGVLLGADRLTRCHRLVRWQHYVKNAGQAVPGALPDPVERYIGCE
jgi:putative component of membrane protein insertase Oxa1/YidC/SpoIIIJ protein YidD